MRSQTVDKKGIFTFYRKGKKAVKVRVSEKGFRVKKRR